MKCPKCGSTEVNKNGHCRGKQNYRCKHCSRQFLEFYSPKGYSDDAKQICLKMYRDGLGFRAIERATGVSHNTIINWVRHTETTQSDPLEIDGGSELDEHDVSNAQSDRYPYKTVQLIQPLESQSQALLQKIL